MRVLTFLTACMFMDLQSRRVPNEFLLLNGLILLGERAGYDALQGEYFLILERMGVVFSVLCVGAVLYKIGAFGGADMKIMSVVLSLMNRDMGMTFIIVSLVLALMQGGVEIIRCTRQRKFLENVVKLVVYRKLMPELHRVPFTCAMTGAMLMLILFQCIHGEFLW